MEPIDVVSLVDDNSSNVDTNMLYCHHCRQKRPESIVKSCCGNNANPEDTLCAKRYCKICFDKYYPGLYDAVIDWSHWTCPYCSSYCCCTRCNGKKYPSYPPVFVDKPQSPPHLLSDSLDDDKSDLADDFHPSRVQQRHPSKKRTRSGRSSQDDSDPAWADLALRYLLYAKRLAGINNVPIANMRQLPSITHMIAISEAENESWRWCDAYHAIKYLKDSGLVITSRGAKGTSIKDDHSTVLDLIHELQLRTMEVNQQGEFRPRKVMRVFPKLQVLIELPDKLAPVDFDVSVQDLTSVEDLCRRVQSMLHEKASHSDGLLSQDSSTTVRLLGYSEKKSGDFIHTNVFTSLMDLVEEAEKIHLTTA